MYLSFYKGACYPRCAITQHVMKKLIMSLIGITLFVAAYQVTRRQTEYTNAQSAITKQPSYVITPTSASADVKNTLAFRLIKPS
jgi:hypothetical protein